MLIDNSKLFKPGKGFKPIVKKEKEEQEQNPNLFYFESEKNWLINSNKRGKYKKNEKK